MDYWGSKYKELKKKYDESSYLPEKESVWKVSESHSKKHEYEEDWKDDYEPPRKRLLD